MNDSTSQSDSDLCVFNIPSRYIFTAWFSMYLLFLPLFLFVLVIGFNKWKKPQPSASGGLSHSDVFTLNMVAMEMMSVAGLCIVCYGYYAVDDGRAYDGEEVVTTTMTGQTLFHSLTCVERYLAVVHPVTYLRLRGEGGVTIRNISVALVWVLTVLYTVLNFLLDNIYYTVCIFVLSWVPLLVVIYCSIYVLCVLIRPKPGEKGGPRREIDQSKRSTVCTMVAILGVLSVRLVISAVCNVVVLENGPDFDDCVLVVSSLWPALPSSLVLPLLFLQRAGKLIVCK